jgi:phage shock protein A
MGIFSRLGTLIKSNLNELISRAEDPQKMLNQIVLDMQNQLVEAKKQVAVSIADEKRLRKQLDEQGELSKEWERKAMMAVRAGDDVLAKEALRRKQEHENQVVEFGKQWELQKQAVDKLKDQLRTLNDKIEEAKRKKNILIARQKRAEAQRAIQDTMRGLSDTSAFDSFDRMAQRVDQIEAEAEAATELGGELTGDTLQQKFKALEGTGAGADHALAELKAKMGLGPAPEARAALPPQNRRVAVEEESEEAGVQSPPSSKSGKTGG